MEFFIIKYMNSQDRSIIGTAILGVLLSTYALYVEMAAEARPGYKALCDISEYASCSRVLTSPQSKGFGLLGKSALEVPNCIYGVIFYCLIIFLTTFRHRRLASLQLLLCVSSVAMSVYLAYLLAFVIRDICVVCISTYVVNALLTLFVWKRNKVLNLKEE